VVKVLGLLIVVNSSLSREMPVAMLGEGFKPAFSRLLGIYTGHGGKFGFAQLAEFLVGRAGIEPATT